MQNEKIIIEVKEIINKIKPYLNRDGGDIEFVKFEDGFVYVKLHGACIECELSDVTLYDGFEKILMEEVPEVLGVRLAD